MRAVSSPENVQNAGLIREWMASYAQAEDLINIGAYVKGSNPKIDQAIFVYDRINAFLRQRLDERATYADTSAAMTAIRRSAESFLQSNQKK